MRENYVESIKEKVLPHVNAVVSGEVKKWKADLHYPVDALFDAFKEDGFEADLGEMTTNGWQWDWWLTVEKDGKKFTLAGSGHYGGLKFFPYEEG